MTTQLYKLLITAGLIVVIFLLRWALNSLFVSRLANLKTRYSWRKGISYFGYIIIALGITVVWIDEFLSAATFLGLLTAGLAVALRDPIVNFFGWLFIITNRPFEMGHRIEIGPNKGDVLDIQFFKFTLLEIGSERVDADQSTGRIIHIPNGKVFTLATINFVQGFKYVWHEIPVRLTFDSNWEKARQILLDIEEMRVKDLEEDALHEIDQSEKRFNIRYSKLTPTVYTTVKEYGILLTLRFLCNPRSLRGTEQLIWEEVLRTFEKEPDLHWAYPGMAVYLKERDSEKKSEK
jgi:small-conductance mechanosensitive channel